VKVSFLSSELGKWDMLEPGTSPEALVLPFFADERPLRGPAGLCDWRLCGRLSRLLGGGQRQERVAGAWGELTLYPVRVNGLARLPFERLVLFGLGPSERFDDACARDASRKIGEALSRLGCDRWAIAPPGRSTGRLSARRALEICIGEIESLPKKPSELVIIESPAGQKEAADLVHR
jgi:hypothetical protein